MAFREVGVVEVREVLRGWLEGAGLRTVGERAGVDRKTARRYVQAAQAAGLVREAGVAALTDELVASVVGAVRPARPSGHGAAWEALAAREEQIRAWVNAGDGQEPLSIMKIEELLSRQGCVVPYRTLHRFAVERCSFRVKTTTVRVADGEPGVECQIDFAQLGYLLDAGTGRRRKVHALIFTSVLSRHMFVWLTYSQTLAAVIAGCEAAWTFYGGGLQGPRAGQPQGRRGGRGRGEPAAEHGLVGLRPARRVRHRPGPGAPASGQAAGGAGGAVRARELLGRGDLHRPGRRPTPGRGLVRPPGPGCAPTARPLGVRWRCSPRSKPGACCRSPSRTTCRCSPG